MAEEYWLEILEQATSYRELQNVFSRMMAEAESSDGDATELAASIDEAIRRIEQERARDSSELEKFSAEYEAFRSEQSGVIGWFKRKLPFGETRKQELQHLGFVNDQNAEILADNFVIARAQMLKERILPSSSRRMGLRFQEWQDDLIRHDSLQTIRDYGKLASQLGRELPLARAFIQSVRADIAAFSEANFTDKEDRAQRDADLLSAEREVKLLESESRDKEGLRNVTLKRLAELIRDELIAGEPAFQTLVTRSGRLVSILERFPKVEKAVSEFQGLLTSACSKLNERNAIPAKRDSIGSNLSRLQREFNDADTKQARAADASKEPTKLYEAATREASAAKAALDAAKRMYDAYVAERNRAISNEAEVGGDLAFDESSPVVGEYSRLQTTLSQAEENLRRVKGTYENAERTLERAKQELDTISKKLEEANKELSSLSDKEDQLSRQIAMTRESLILAKNSMQSELENHANQLQEIDWLESFRSMVGVPSELIHDYGSHEILPSNTSWSRLSPSTAFSRELAEHRQKLDVISRFAKTLTSDKAVIEKEVASLSVARKDAMRRRCETLIGNELSSDVSFE